MALNLAFGLLGVIILLGFAGSMLFARTRVPDLMGLILVGILLGPVLGLLRPAQLAPITPYFATLAMIIILFEGGLGLDLKGIMRRAGAAFAFSLATFMLSVGAVAGVSLLFGYDLMVGLLLGAIVGGTSGAIVLPLVTRLSASEDAKGILTIESALTDVLCLVSALTLIGVLGTQPLTQPAPLAALGANFSVGLVSGVGGGLAWLKLLPWLERHPLSYMLTLAAIFLLYSSSQILGGSGAMACLTFGLVLGNSRVFDPETPLVSEGARRRILDFHSEVAFFVRTFFFVYIGLIFDVERATTGGTALAVAAMGALMGVRWLSVTAYTRLRPAHRPERGLLFSMLPRGLAAAVLAPLPLAAGISRAGQFSEIVLIVIVASNLVMTAGAFVLSMGRGQEPDRRPGWAPDAQTF
jgi:cell volume regulation protein A